MNDKDMNGGEKTMKSNRKKRILAAVLCMVMVLSSSISALAGEEIFVDIPEASEEFSSEPMVVTETESAGEAFTETEASPEISFSDGDVTADVETEAPVDPETPAEPAPEVPEETPSEEAVPETPADEIPAEEENFADFGDGMSDSVADAQILSEETELKQEFVDEAGNVVQRVTAKLPAGAFAAETSSITMEVSYLDTDSEKYLKSMMNENIPEGMLLGSYVFFNVQFKVNGEKAESLKPVEITIEGSGLTVTDTKKANVFYFDPADPSVEGDKDELKEIPQRSEVLESLQLAGQSTENIEDYDLSEITFREDGITDKIIFEGRKSTIYGCYTEEVKPEEEIPAEPAPVPEEITPIPEEPVPEEPETEEPAPETVSEIEIISDEVNLRTEPDEEAENVIATAFMGERFPFLENVQMEEVLWYKIQYTYPETGETAELYVRSDFAKVVDETPEVSDDVDLSEEPGMVNELTYEDDKITVSVSAAEEGIIPDGASLSVKPITAENAETQEQYEEVAQHVEQKVAEEEKEVAGFLAYDITFVDPEGNKLEPNGEVKVSMNYKEAVIPETVTEEKAETAEVSVLHLEEDETGAVQNVVDMTAEESAAAAVQTTENAEIQRAEFNTTSFSVYTIIWTQNGNRRNRPKVRLNFVNENGQDISRSLGVKDQSIDIDTENGNLANADGSLKSLQAIGEKYNKDDLCFMDAHIGNYKGTIATNISYNETWKNPWLFYVNGKWVNCENVEWWQKEVEVYMVYGKDALPTVATVDHSINNGIETGITMRMINYNSAANGIDIGGGYGDGSIKYDLLKKTLRNGYPVTKGGTSLSSLFSGGRTVNHLFLKDVYDRTGYYEYSSFDNYAYLGDKNSFTVYDAKGTPSNETRYYFQRGNFMPYNRIQAGKFSTNKNLYDEYGQKLNSGASGYNDRLYKTQGNDDFYFGMYLAANFLQPKDGMALHKGSESPMRYEFNGDDDLWVFIDDVLVLDIGGIHDAHSGYIDFSTGEIGWYDCTTGNTAQLHKTTIKKRFSDAEKSTRDFEGNTFKDYTKHNFKMFYMERGAGASNLHVKFNLQTIPDGQIQVTKQLEQETDPVLYGDVRFGFELYVETANTNGQGTGRYEKVTSDDLQKYEAKLKKTDGSTDDLTMNDQGIFYLKPKETAVFNKIPANLKYYVKEVEVDSDKFDYVEVNGTLVTDKYGDKEDRTYYSAQSTKDTVENRPSVEFTNSCNAKNLRTLQVEKKMSAGQTSEEEFEILVELEKEDGELHPYSGPYTVFAGDNLTGTRKETTDGRIKLKQNEVANIYNILSETQFRVKEIELDIDKYEQPIYQVSEDKDNPDSYKDGNEGEIQLKKHAKVIITNSYKATVSVEKIWKPSVPSGINGVYVGLYQLEQERLIPVKDKYILLSAENEWKHTFTGMSGTSEQYVVRELQKTDGSGDFTIDGSGYTGIDEHAAVMFGDTKYVVEYEEEQDSSRHWTITNTAPWQIIKISESNAVGGDRLSLQGAIFTASTDDGIIYTGTSDSNGIVKWKDGSDQEMENLPGGKIYTVTESKAPSGYLISEKNWIVDLTGELPKITYDNVRLDSEQKDGIITFYFTNTPLYDLPSTGGNGIYVYMIGGVALMMAAMFILYKMKCKGVRNS